MTGSLQELLNRKLPLEESVVAYDKWVETGENLEDAFCAVFPLLRNMTWSLRQKFEHKVDHDDLVSCAAEALHKFLLRRSPRSTDGLDRDSVVMFAGFIRTVVVSGIIDRSRVSESRLTPRLVHMRGWTGEFNWIGKTPTMKQSDIRLYLEQLPAELGRSVVRSIRFKGDERDACVYILDRILRGRNPVLSVLRNHFELPLDRSLFLVDYVTVKIRMCLRELSVDLGDLITEEKSIFSTSDLKLGDREFSCQQ